MSARVTCPLQFTSYRLRNALTVALRHAERVTAATVSSAAATSPGTTCGPSSYIQAPWISAPGPSSNLSSVEWNRASVTGSPAPFVLDNGAVISRLPLALPLLPGGQSLPDSNPRYTNFRSRPTGKGTVIYHDSDENSGEQYVQCALDLSAGSGIFASPSILPVPPGPQYNNDRSGFAHGWAGVPLIGITTRLIRRSPGAART